MKITICDLCKVRINDPLKMVYMREIFYRKKPSKKEKIHICQECLNQICEISRKRSDTNDR